jgi:hypothetical protein
MEHLIFPSTGSGSPEPKLSKCKSNGWRYKMGLQKNNEEHNQIDDPHPNTYNVSNVDGGQAGKQEEEEKRLTLPARQYKKILPIVGLDPAL